MDIKNLVPRNLLQWAGGAIIGATVVLWIYTNIIIPQNARMYDSTLRELNDLRSDHRELAEKFESAIDDKSDIKEKLLEINSTSKDALRNQEKLFTNQLIGYERKLDKFNTTAQLDTVYMSSGDIFLFQSGTASIKCLEYMERKNRYVGMKLLLQFPDKKEESFYLYYNERNVVEHDNMVYYIYCLDPNSLVLKNKDYYETKTIVGGTPVVVYVLSK